MDLVRALVLGAVQGLTEFFPVSSSGHLVIVRRVFGWADEGLAFDAVLHFGTLLAVLVSFRSVWMRLLRGRARPLLVALLLGTVPGAVAGLLGERLIEQQFRSMASIGISFMVTAVFLALAERSRGSPPPPAIVFPSSFHAFLIGIAQAFALVPGLSRSGLTMAAAMLLGQTRASAVEFSFLLALPITAAASLGGLREVSTLAPAHLAAAGVGVLAAFIAGLASIAWLLRLVRTHTFFPFALYLLVTGLLTLLLRG